jgi:uncharacterized protein YecE (DUF72 family)
MLGNYTMSAKRSSTAQCASDFFTGPQPMQSAPDLSHGGDPAGQGWTWTRRDLLVGGGVAAVVAASDAVPTGAEEVTAGFIYLRLHGDRQLYRSGYGPRALARWAERIAGWHRGTAARRKAARDVFCFFDNTDAKLRAPFDARVLMRLLAHRLLRRPSPDRARHDIA